MKEKGNNNNNHNRQDKRERRKEREQKTVYNPCCLGFSGDQVQSHLLLRIPSSASELEGVTSVTVLKTL